MSEKTFENGKLENFKVFHPLSSISTECCITFPHWGGKEGKWKRLQYSAEIGVF